MAPPLPTIEACKKCFKEKKWRLYVSKAYDLGAADVETHFFLCYCGITALESKNGGPWAWREKR